MVTFTPIEATIGPAVTGSFEDGAYRFSREDGPVPGKYNVTIELVVPEVLTAEQRHDLEGVMTAAAGDFKIGV
jgi:hypothetical protein